MTQTSVHILTRVVEAEASDRWDVVNTQATREHVAAAHLRRQAYGVFLPSAWRTIRRARKVTAMKSGYFPDYLFVTMDLDLDRDRWRPIEGPVGVMRIIEGAEQPLAAPLGLVEMLLSATGPDRVLRLFDPVTWPGQEVRITRGTFADQLAVVERSSGEDRVRVLLSVLRQRAPVELLRHELPATLVQPFKHPSTVRVFASVIPKSNIRVLEGVWSRNRREGHVTQCALCEEP